MMRVVDVVLRLLLGLTFVVSGWLKADDPWGFYYKLTEYAGGAGMGWMPEALLWTVTFVVPAFEFVLGVSLVLNIFRRAVSVLTAVFMIVMTGITVWIYATESVADCGCFGDAVVISNGMTLLKNVVLLGFSLVHLFVAFRSGLSGCYTRLSSWLRIVVSIVYIGVVSWYCMAIQPYIDFRSYPVGTSLVFNDEDDDAEDQRYVYIRDGELRRFSAEELPDESDGWEFVDVESVNEKPHLSVYLDDEEVSDSLFRQPHLLLGVLPDGPLSESVEVPDGVDVVWIYGKNVPERSYSADDTSLKELVRGNPGIVSVENGIVMAKSTYRAYVAGCSDRGSAIPVAATVVYLIVMFFAVKRKEC